MKNSFYKFRFLFLLTITPFGLLAQQKKPDADEVLTLDVYDVIASADASAGGLRLPYAGGQVASGGRIGVLGNLDYMEAPFTLTSYTQSLISDQQAASVGEVLLNDPGVRVARGFGNYQQLYMVRGLPIYSDDMTYNGLYGLLPRQYLASEVIERVEVLRGANAFLNGAAPGGSALGGSVNVMPKRAGNEPLARLTSGVQSGGQLYSALDLSERYLDGALGLRFNGALRDGDTAIDGESSQLTLMSLGADFHTEKLRVSADFGYQDHQRNGAQPSVTISSGLAIPETPDASKSIAQSWTYSNERDVFGTIRSEYDLTEKVTVWAAVGMREGVESSIFANPTMINDAGDTTSYRFDNVRNDYVRTGEIGIRSQFDTGIFSHSISASYTAYKLESENAYAMSAFTGVVSNIYNPVDVVLPEANFFTGGDMDDPSVTEKTETASFALADVISVFDEKFFIIGGLRHQAIETHSYDYNTGAESASYDKSAVTPVTGLLYRVNQQVSIFANYIEGLTSGEVAPSVSGNVAVVNTGEVLSPYKTDQFEVGLKFDFGRIGGSISAYNSQKPISGVNDEGYFVELSDQTNKGLDISVYGMLGYGVKLLGGVSLLDTDVDGLEGIGSPDTQLNLGMEWDVPQVNGLSLDWRVIYTSEQFADSANTQVVSDWTRLDIGLRYDTTIGTTHDVSFRLRIENIADKDYWASAGGYPGAGYLTIGNPRTFIASVSYDF